MTKRRGEHTSKHAAPVARESVASTGLDGGPFGDIIAPLVIKYPRHR
jgi:hypothetical protein